jgi:hypothetical protein
MKSSGRRVGLFLGSAAVLLLGSLAVGASPALAAGHARSPAATPTPVGLYTYSDGDIITEGDAPATITINANGTFTLLYASITDTGVWLQDGKTIALTVTSGEDGSGGCLLLGTIMRKGINSAAKQGPIDCNAEFGKVGTWYAAIPRHVR